MKALLYYKFILLVTPLFLITFYASAQGSATATASANIITPIGITKNFDLNFGNASVSPAIGGSVAMTPAGARSISGGGVTLPAATGTVSAAAFTVSGAPAFTFAISLPVSAVISGSGSATMTVNNFTSTPAGAGSLSSSGNATVSVGATLVVAAGQQPGAYTNATAIPVTVNYN